MTRTGIKQNKFLTVGSAAQVPIISLVDHQRLKPFFFGNFEHFFGRG